MTRVSLSSCPLHQQHELLTKLTFVTNNQTVGKTLAYTTVTFRNQKGELCARGSHTKYVANAWKSQNGTELFTPPEGAVIAEDDVE